MYFPYDITPDILIPKYPRVVSAPVDIIKQLTPPILSPTATPIMPSIVYPTLQPVLQPVITTSTILPTISTIPINYPDLNSDIVVQKKIIDKIWNKLKNEWMYNYTKIFTYIKGSKGNFNFVSSLKEAENNKFTTSDIDDKINWFLSEFYTKSSLLTTIEKFRSNTNVDLWDVDKDESLLKDFIYHQLKRKLLNKYA